VKIEEALRGVSRLFLDTAPVIYFVEATPTYLARVTVIFEQIDALAIEAVTSPITLAECLVHPYRLGLTSLQKDFTDLITAGKNTHFSLIGQSVALTASEFRARYNLALTDALQLATALEAGCEAFLTNDRMLKRVTELRILVLDEIEL
jgi:predicted nucleic acid-binding protein